MGDLEQLWPEGPVLRQAPHFRLGTDCVLLADFVRADAARRGIELGCASGAAMLLLLARTQKLHMTGLELNAEAAELARENMAANAFTERSAVVTGDLRRCRELFPAGSFDLVVANPPYYPLGSGALPADAARAEARAETCCTLDELCAAASWLLHTGGAACLVHKPERLSELLVSLTAHGLEPKRLRLVCARPGAAPSLALIEGRRGGAPGLVIERDLILEDENGAPSLVLVEARRGGKPGLRIEPPLLLRGEDGGESEELRRICRRG